MQEEAQECFDVSMSEVQSDESEHEKEARLSITIRNAFLIA
jgi:hypothetical protein